MVARIIRIVGFVSCIALVLNCFMPWVYVQSINDTFTGFHVTRFPSGTYYGRAGIFISILTAIIFIFMLIPVLWAKRANLLLAALLFAYSIRTYIIFTSALFENEIVKKPGIYLQMILAFFILVASAFPTTQEKQASASA
mgnify:CR=1 FL=1|jgi:hypothetical protein